MFITKESFEGNKVWRWKGGASEEGLKGAVCTFRDEIQTQNFCICNMKEEIKQSQKYVFCFVCFCCNINITSYSSCICWQLFCSNYIQAWGVIEIQKNNNNILENKTIRLDTYSKKRTANGIRMIILVCNYAHVHKWQHLMSLALVLSEAKLTNTHLNNTRLEKR